MFDNTGNEDAEVQRYRNAEEILKEENRQELRILKRDLDHWYEDFNDKYSQAPKHSMPPHMKDAVTQDDIPAIEMILSYGCWPINGIDREGLSPMDYALATGNNKIIEWLRQHGAE